MTKPFQSQILYKIYYLQKFYLNEKLNLYYHFLVKNFQINARNKLTAKCILTFSHYIWQLSLCKN